MGRKILLNGKLVKNQITIPVLSTALNYGKGFFETILYENHKLYFYNSHIKRLEETCTTLSIDYDFETLSPEKIYMLINKNGDMDKVLRVKILYFPLVKEEWDTCVYTVDYNRETEPMTICGHYEERERFFANFKTTSYFENVYWRDFYSRRYKVDEVLFRNTGNNFVEGSYTNLFCVKDRVLFCPDINNDFLKGIMYTKILKNYRAIGFEEIYHKRQGIRDSFIKGADEVFLTNSLFIARSVGMFFDTTKNRYYKLMGRSWARKIRDFFLV